MHERDLDWREGKQAARSFTSTLVGGIKSGRMSQQVCRCFPFPGCDCAQLVRDLHKRVEEYTYSLGRHDENGAKRQNWTLIFDSHSPVDNRVNRDFDTVQVCRDLCSFVLLLTKILSWVGVRMLSGALIDATYGPKFWLPHKKICSC
jgi:hypothetical protein